MKSVRRQCYMILRRAHRSYSTQLAGKHADGKPSFSAQEPKVNKLSSGVPVASLENYSPVTQVAVIYNAGARHEPLDQPGITHCIRWASNLSSQRATAFGIARNLQQIGATLSCTTTREHMIYIMTCLRDDLDVGAEILGQVAVAPAFKPWELSDVARRLHLDVETYHRSPNHMLIDLLHKAAYRDTLGQSLYMTADRIGTFTPDQMEMLVASHYVSGNMAVAGVGVDVDTLQHIADKFPVVHGAKPAVEKAKYHGGEQRVDMNSRLVHAAIVTEGVSLSSEDLLSVAVLTQALGATPAVDFAVGHSAASRLHKTVAAAVTDDMFAVKSFSSSYSDSGLFGIHTVASSQNIGKVLKAVVSAMGQVTKSGITEAELQRAKQQLKARVSMDNETSPQLVENMASQVLLAGRVFTPADVDKSLDSVTLDMVNKVAKKMITSRPSMAAVGNLANTPYLDELL